MRAPAHGVDRRENRAQRDPSLHGSPTSNGRCIPAPEATIPENQWRGEAPCLKLRGMTSVTQPRQYSVLHIGAGRYEIGGQGHPTLLIWRELAKGFRRYTVVARSTTRRRGHFTDHGVDIRLVPSCYQRELEFFFTQFSAEHLAEEVEADVVICQCPVLGGLAATRIRRRRAARTLFEFHSSFYFEDHPVHSRYGFLKRLARRNLPNADRIRVLSDGMRTRLLAQYGQDLAPRVVVLPPRVDVSIFERTKRSYALVGRPKVVIVGAINGNKGQYRFLEAVLPTYPDIEIQIVGSGPDLSICQQSVARHKAEGRVTFCGQRTPGEVAAILPSADALVVFSQTEGTPRVIIEAMAVGLPVVTTNAGFCADLVRHGIDGFVLGPDPESEIVDRLQSLFADEGVRERFGRSAFERARREYDSKEVFARYRDLIRETAQL